MAKESTELIHVTKNLRFAAALTAAGFALRQANRVHDEIKKTDYLVYELAGIHHGISADTLGDYFNYSHKLESQVNEIIKVRGLELGEYIILAFDAAIAAMRNRATIIHCLEYRKPLIARDIGNGRSIIFREGTPDEQLRAILLEANK